MKKSQPEQYDDQEVRAMTRRVEDALKRIQDAISPMRAQVKAAAELRDLNVLDNVSYISLIRTLMYEHTEILRHQQNALHEAAHIDALPIQEEDNEDIPF